MANILVIQGPNCTTPGTREPAYQGFAATEAVFLRRFLPGQMHRWKRRVTRLARHGLIDQCRSAGRQGNHVIPFYPVKQRLACVAPARIPPASALPLIPFYPIWSHKPGSLFLAVPVKGQVAGQAFQLRTRGLEPAPQAAPVHPAA